MCKKSHSATFFSCPFHFQLPVCSRGAVFQLRNGLVLRGSKVEIASLKEGFGAAAAGESNVRPIWMIDDGLRRTYLHGKGMLDGVPVDIGDLEGPIELWQPIPLGGKVVAGLGNAIGVSHSMNSGDVSLQYVVQMAPFRLFKVLLS